MSRVLHAGKLFHFMLPGQMAQYQRAATVALHSLAVFHMSEILRPHTVLFPPSSLCLVKLNHGDDLGLKGLHTASLQRQNYQGSSGASRDPTSDSSVTVTRSESPIF